MAQQQKQQNKANQAGSGTPSHRNQFEQEAAAERSSIVGEFWYFIKTNKKWWLLPILISIALVGVLVALSSSGVAPFIYTLF